MPRGIFIGDIPFFQNYWVYLKCKKAAKKAGIKYRYFIVQCINDYLQTNINTPERLHDDCLERANTEGITIAQLIEKICAAKVDEAYDGATIHTPTTPTLEEAKKRSWFELPKG